MEIIENIFHLFMSEVVVQDKIPTMTIQHVFNDDVIISMFPQPSPLLMREVRRVPHGL